MRNLSDNLLSAFLLLLPVQTVWILREVMLGGEKWQYGTIGIYAMGIAASVALATYLRSVIRGRPFPSRLFSGSIGSFLRRYPEAVALAAFLSWAGLSVSWSSDHALAAYSFANLALSVGIFFPVRDAVRKNGIGSVADILIFSALVQAAIGIAQFFLQDTVSSTMFGMSAHEAWRAGTSVLKIDAGRFLRAYGTFAHPNAYGLFLSVGLLLAVRSVMSLPEAGARKPKDILILAGIPLLVLGSLVSFSRSAWIGFGLGLFVLTIRSFPVSGRIVGTRVAAAVAAVLLPVIVFSWPLADIVSPRFSGEAIVMEGSATDRMTTYRDALDIVRVHPLSGAGIGSLTADLIHMHPERPIRDIQPAHDVPLLILAELGIVGLLLSGFLAFRFFWLPGRKSDTVAIAILFAVLPSLLLDHFLWTSTFGLLFSATLFGIVAACLSGQNNKTDAGPDRLRAGAGRSRLFDSRISIM